jgi:hypothetical protein
MGRTISDAVRGICLALPEVAETVSHGSPEYRVGKRSFATYAVNHHGDGRVALWLRMPPGAQSLYVDAEPDYFFVPPYVGPRGWLGVELDRGLAWPRIDALVREAYGHTAPQHLRARMGPPGVVAAPTEAIDPEAFDPLSPPRVQQILDGLRTRCLQWPEVSETTQFGNPAWRAGSKTFCTAHRRRGRLQLYFWVGAEQQSLLCLDERYSIPDYIGHNGWIALDAEAGVRWDEVEALALGSYRHFALKRMLKGMEKLG